MNRTKLSIAVAVALFVLSPLACKKPSAVGGECSSRDDCAERNDCLKLPSGSGVCTKSCLPSSPGDCPPPTTCQSIAMSVDVPGKTVNIPKINRCLPK